MKPPPGRPLIKTSLALLFLVLFVGGMGRSAFFPSMRLLQDTAWDFSLFPVLFPQKILAIGLMALALLGFLGWAGLLRAFLFPRMEKGTGLLLGFSVALSVFALFTWALAVNEILWGSLEALFFVPVLKRGWVEGKERMVSWAFRSSGIHWAWLFLPILLWAAEYLSPPLAWDAVLDHFRYARETARLHQVLFHWVNHTGDMTKLGEMVLAGFWSLGGEDLAKLSSSLPALLTVWTFALFSREWKGEGGTGPWIFWTCPFFLALYSWGYVEGFLAAFELLAVLCLWKASRETNRRDWPMLAAFFLGTAFAIKVTALLMIAPLLFLAIWMGRDPRGRRAWSPVLFLSFLIPAFPWLLKNGLAFGDPFYPLATKIFGSAMGYSPEMEQGLLADTGLPGIAGLLRIPLTLWSSFFTLSNAVNAAWTPLALMGLPWMGTVLKKPLGRYLAALCLLSLAGWVFASQSLRHCSGGMLVWTLLAAMAWDEALRGKRREIKPLFAIGVVISVWLCLSAQWTTTTPYASALGMESPLARLQRHYSYGSSVYAAYRDMERHSQPRDKVMAFAVFQTYPLDRMAFVDFKWKRPIFLEWATQCGTAERLAKKLREEGVEFFLYQAWEAGKMSRVEKDFDLPGMDPSEYRRFWDQFMEPVGLYENCTVYRVRTAPAKGPSIAAPVPGIAENIFRSGQ